MWSHHAWECVRSGRPWAKPIHARGCVAKVRWHPALPQQQQGARPMEGLLRFSSALLPKPKGLVPAVALKLFQPRTHAGAFSTICGAALC